MSDLTDLVNGTATAVVGMAGIVGTFVGGRAASRESRHHARLESIYEGLAEFLVGFGALTERIGTHQGLSQDQQNELRDRFDKELRARFDALVARLQLYAGATVINQMGELIPLVDAIGSALQSPPVADERDESIRVVIAKFNRLAGDLLDSMRRELALPVRRWPRWRIRRS